MLSVARGLQEGLSHDDMTVIVWTDGVFQASQDSVSSLVAAAELSDLGILVVGADDMLLSRGREMATPRDNVVFEIGLFMGAIGRTRTFVVQARGIDLHLPSDLLGLTPIEYELGNAADMATRLGPVCTKIRELVRNLGVK